MPLDPCAQQLDFSLGAFQAGAAEREPPNAAEQIVGLLGSDGLPYRRGGSVYKSNAAVGTGLLWLADAALAGGQRTFFQAAGDNKVYALGVDDATPAQIGGVTVPIATGPFRPPVVNGAVQIVRDGGTTGIRYWAGSRKTSNYSAGTVTVNQGSRTVAGAGTTWTTNLDTGMFLDSLGGGGQFVPISSVDSNTQATLAFPWPYPNLPPGSSYAMRPTFSIGTSGVIGPIQASLAGRFFWAFQNVVQFSPAGQFTGSTETDYHSFPTDIRGLGILRDVLLVFTTGGVYSVSGMAYPLVDSGSGDPLQRKELVNADLIAWGHEGIASWEGALVVPALDDVYLMDSLGAPTPIGDRILDLYLSYVRAGYVPGVAEVYNGHYFLPILNGTAWVDTLVCRLQPSHSGNNFAWTQLSGDGATVAAFAERQTVPPLLLAASRQATSRVLDDSAFFKPAGAVKNDASGNGIPFVVKTIDYPTGNSVSNFVHHVRLRYELTDAAADNPTISAVAAVDGGAGGNTFALTGVAVEDVGEKVWRVNRHAKNVQFTFTVANASASCKIKSVEVFVRHSGRQ